MIWEEALYHYCSLAEKDYECLVKRRPFPPAPSPGESGGIPMLVPRHLDPPLGKRLVNW